MTFDPRGIFSTVPGKSGPKKCDGLAETVAFVPTDKRIHTFLDQLVTELILHFDGFLCLMSIRW